MKKGKTEKLNGFKTSKVHYGTVDSKNFKSYPLTTAVLVKASRSSKA